MPLSNMLNIKQTLQTGREPQAEVAQGEWMTKAEPRCNLAWTMAQSGECGEGPKLRGIWND